MTARLNTFFLLWFKPDGGPEQEVGKSPFVDKDISTLYGSYPKKMGLSVWRLHAGFIRNVKLLTGVNEFASLCPLAP